MKKITTLGVCLLFLSVSVAVAIPVTEHRTAVLLTSGTFDGSIGYRRANNTTILGTLSGTYEQRNRGGRFSGDWVLQNRTGTIRGGFARIFLIGKVTVLVNGTQRSIPIVGFIKANNGQFRGRFMAPIGPPLYFWGEYT
jgi:hypothetical protein